MVLNLSYTEYFPRLTDEQDINPHYRKVDEVRAR